MDIEEIKILTTLMVDNDLSEIIIRDGDKRILLRRKGANSESVVALQQAPAIPATLPAALPPPSAASSPTESHPDEDSGLKPIQSPMVGTFYAAGDPESPPFVKIGDHITPDTIIAIIEAMKVFNEIKAEMAGTIESIEVHNAAAVEFGQVLMKVRPD